MQLAGWPPGAVSVSGKLYGDHEEAIFESHRSDGVEATPDRGASRSDFLDRAVSVEFLDIKPEIRRDEGRFWGRIRRSVSANAWCAARCRCCWNYEPAERQPRQSLDFAVRISACEERLGTRRVVAY